MDQKQAFEEVLPFNILLIAWQVQARCNVKKPGFRNNYKEGKEGDFIVIEQLALQNIGYFHIFHEVLFLFYLAILCCVLTLCLFYYFFCLFFFFELKELLD